MKKWRENSKAKMGGQANWRKDKNNPKNKKTQAIKVTSSAWLLRMHRTWNISIESLHNIVGLEKSSRNAIEQEERGVLILGWDTPNN